MLDDKDIKKLIEVFATREEVATKQDFEELKGDFRNLQDSIGAYSNKLEY